MGIGNIWHSDADFGGIMNYVSYTYLFIFLILTFITYYLVPLKKRWIVILVSSIIFYLTSSHPKLIVFVLISALSVYFGGLKLDSINEAYKEKKKGLEKQDRKALKETLDKKKKRIQIFLILFNIAFIAVLKYSIFLTIILNGILGIFKVHIPGMRFFVPLGISYYTLQAISYVVDISRGKYKADHHFGKVFNYLIFFGTITEGPIAKFDEVADQIHTGHPFNYANFQNGVQLIMWGLFKKLIVADRANLYVHEVFRTLTHYHGIVNLVGIILYTIQLYTDFSGCMDIVRGSALMLGITLPENFKQPFFSASVNEFWRRWHITLGAWLKEYVLFSVTLSKPFKNISKWFKDHCNAYFGRTLPVVFSSFFVWFIMGIWHGVGIKFIIYGLYYYIIMALGLLCKPLFDKCIDVLHINVKSKPYHVFQVIRTFILINFGMLLFRVSSMRKFYDFTIGIFDGFNLFDPRVFSIELELGGKEWIVLLIGILVVVIVDVLHEKGYELRKIFNTKPIYVRYICYFVIFFTIFIFGAYGSGYDSVAFLYGAY